MSRHDQLVKWRQGIAIHDDHTGRCTPDFACCSKDGRMADPKLRHMLLNAFERGQDLREQVLELGLIVDFFGDVNDVDCMGTHLLFPF